MTNRSCHSPATTIRLPECALTLRRFDGPLAAELFLHGRPTRSGDAGQQAEAIYRALNDALSDAGGNLAHVVSETVFVRESGISLAAVRAARDRVASDGHGASPQPARTEIQQPPLDDIGSLEVSMHALLPGAAVPQRESVDIASDCDCPDCAQVHGLTVRLGYENRFQASGVCGRGADAYEQTLAMFAQVEKLLRQAGMTFQHVVRTWIYLRDIERDYAALNRARRRFFASRNVDPVPASTGIGGAMAAGRHALCMSVYAVASGAGVPPRTVMTSASLNEAAQYGADFVRGMKVVEANRIALHVSGTASVNEVGATVHRGDVAAQADRMLLNIGDLLHEQGAGVGDIVSAISYLKAPGDAATLRARFRQAGFEGFPNAVVVAPVCRADLLCETEVLALLPGTASPANA